MTSILRVLRRVGANRKNLSDPSRARPTDTANTNTRASLRSETTDNPSDEPSSFPTTTITQNQTTSIHDGDGSESQVSVTKEDLWDLAYELLKKDTEKSRLIEKYDNILREDSGNGSAVPVIAHDVAATEGREQQMSRVVQTKFQAVQDARWKFEFFSKEIEVRKQFDRAAGAVIWAKDFITQAVSPDPHAALAWAGVCVLLPLLLNPSQQRNAAICGLDTVSNLIRQSKVIDEIYFESAVKTKQKTQALRALMDEFRVKRIKLYSMILEFEAQLVCYFSLNKVEQTVRDMIKYDAWDGMVENIQKMGQLSESDRQIIDAERMKAEFDKLESGMRDALNELSCISKSIENEFSERRHQREDQKRRDILTWLSPLDFGTVQNNTLSRRQAGTGQWLFGDAAFECWLCGEERTLWCYGIPGVGKTVLVSTVIDYIERRFYKDNVGIAFLYCNYKERDTQTAQTLIGSLAQQLVQRHADVPSDLKALYDDHSRNRQTPTPPTVRECLQLLKSQLVCCSTTFLVVDALDECDDQTQSEFCAELQDLPGSTHVLITSRDNPELEDQIRPSTRLEIRVSNKDMEMYLEDRIKKANRLNRLTQKDAELRPLVIKTILEKAQGMFLLAKLQLDSLTNKQTSNDVRNAIGHLPLTLDETYDEAIKRIFQQNKDDARLGGKVLAWISYAKRPLTVDEMQHAVKVETNSTSIGKGDLISKEILVSVCAGIVTVDQGSNIIRLVHYTTQEYLLRTRSVHFPDAEQDIGNACLTYLLFDNFKDGYCKTDEELESLHEENALLDYAARNWADHAREVSRSVMGTALKFLEDRPRTSLSFQVMEIGTFRYHGYSQAPSKYLSGLHLCAYFGMCHMIMEMIERRSEVEKSAELESKDDQGWTPLSWAAAQGHEAVVKLLLEKGAELESKDNMGGTPLSWAAARRHEAVVKLLLEKGTELESKDDQGQTPLSWAAAHGDEAVVKLLLEKGAELESKDALGLKPLSWAASLGREAVVKLLLEKGAELESEDNMGGTPLLRAAARGHEVVVKLLLEKGAELESKNNRGETPLSWAAAQGHEAVVKLLLEKGANNSQII